VFKAGVRAAILERSPSGIEFSYWDGYDGPPVATTLPVDGGTSVWPAGAVPLFFAGLLPEGRRLGALRRSMLYGDTTMALTINGKADQRIGRSDVMAFAATTGLSERAAARVANELSDAVDAWLPGVDVLPFDERRLHTFRRAVAYRRDRLTRR
jgi:HipA-like protein